MRRGRRRKRRRRRDALYFKHNSRSSFTRYIQNVYHFTRTERKATDNKQYGAQITQELCAVASMDLA